MFPGRFGRLPHNPEHVASVQGHVMALGEPLPLTVTPPAGFVPLAVRNDVWPTCVVAGLVNSARLWAMTKHNFDFVTDESLLLEFYATAANCTVAEIGQTNGLVMLDALKLAQSKGFIVSSQLMLIPIFRRIEISDTLEMCEAIANCGSAFVGWDLQESDVRADSEWTGAAKGPLAGGHCAPAIGYHIGGLTDATWGAEKSCDDAWAESRVSEAYRIEWALAAT